jgi:hypothetical protein
MRITVFWDVTPSSMAAGTNILEESAASIFIFFYPADGDFLFLWNTDKHQPDYTTSHLRRQ